MNITEKVARAICAAQTPAIDPDAIVEWGPPCAGPKGTRVVLESNQNPAWELFYHDAMAAIAAMREPDTDATIYFGACTSTVTTIVPRETGGY